MSEAKTKLQLAIRPIIDVSERRAARVRAELDAGEIDVDTALWRTAAILKDTQTQSLNVARDLLIDIAIIKPLAAWVESQATAKPTHKVRAAPSKRGRRPR